MNEQMIAYKRQRKMSTKENKQCRYTKSECVWSSSCKGGFRTSYIGRAASNSRNVAQDSSCLMLVTVNKDIFTGRLTSDTHTASYSTKPVIRWLSDFLPEAQH